MAPATTFSELKPPLCPESLGVLSAQGLSHATPVQSATIPLLCCNKDVAVEAVTGSGKTLAFLLPTVEILRKIKPPLAKFQVGALLVAPTRELAAQVATVAHPLLAAALPKLRLQLLVGGTSVAADRAAIAEHGVNVLVGTPGRLHDILSRHDCPLELRTLEVLILDEADRLLEMGFHAHLTALLELLPRQRRTGLFSATQSKAVAELARAGLRNPVRVQVLTTYRPRAATAAAAGGVGAAAVDTENRSEPAAAGQAEVHERVDERVGCLQGKEEEDDDNQRGGETSRKEKKEKKKKLQKTRHEAEDNDGHTKGREVARSEAAVAAAGGLAAVGGAGVGQIGEPQPNCFEGGGAGAVERCSSEPAVASSSMRVPSSLHLEAMVCESRERSSYMVQWLEQRASQKTILFVMTCACVEFWAAVLPRLKNLSKLRFISLHGKMKQAKRDASVARFSSLESNVVLVCTDVAARGLDFPGVHAILQFDPPQDPKAFLHRAGRTARMGRSGSAMVLLMAKEDAYVEFIRLQGAPVQLLPSPQQPPPYVVQQLRAAAMADRAIVEKGARALVSFFRGYKEHHCNFIFRWKDTEWGAVALSYGLLQMPSMPEMKRRPYLLKGWEDPPLPVDVSAIRYKDKARNKQRKQQLTAAAAAAATGVTGSVSKRVAAPAGRERKEVGGRETAVGEGEEGVDPIKQKKQDVTKAAAGGMKGTGKRKKKQRDRDDSDMEEEYRLLRKAKKGKISERQLDEALGLKEEAEEESGGV